MDARCLPNSNGVIKISFQMIGHPYHDPNLCSNVKHTLYDFFQNVLA
jgi:hypothetical protein